MIEITGIERPQEEAIAKIIKQAWPKSCVEIVIQGELFNSLEEAEATKEPVQKTFYCYFLPLGLYCSFGASNIHHAYNKAAKLWGAKPMTEAPEDHFICKDVYMKRARIVVYEKAPSTGKEIPQTLMTKFVKAWKEENYIQLE